MQYTVFPLPAYQFADGFGHQIMRSGGIGIETLPHHQNNVSPPLCALAVGTIKIIVAHVDIQRTQGFIPETVVEIIAALKRAFGCCIVSCLAVFNGRYFDNGRYCKQYFLSVEPPVRFVFLHPFARDVFCP